VRCEIEMGDPLLVLGDYFRSPIKATDMETIFTYAQITSHLEKFKGLILSGRAGFDHYQENPNDEIKAITAEVFKYVNNRIAKGKGNARETRMFGNCVVLGFESGEPEMSDFSALHDCAVLAGFIAVMVEDKDLGVQCACIFN